MDSGTQTRWPGRLLAALAATAALGLAGCSGEKAGGTRATARASPAEPPDAEVQAERDKLSPEDRGLVDAQEWCAVTTDSRLGSMGPPLKLSVQGQPVFVCCKGCQKKALADPDKTLAAVAELKAKAAKGKS